MTDAASDASDFSRSYEFLSQLPPALYEPVVSANAGDLRTRVEGVGAWRRILLEGRLPTFEEAPWPARAVHASITTALGSLGIARFCRKNEDVTDALVAQLVSIAETSASRADDALSALARALRVKADTSKAERKAGASVGAGLGRASGALMDALGGGSGAPGGTADGETKESREAQELADAAVLSAVVDDASSVQKSLVNEWGERVRVWSELESVFGELGLLTGIGFDLSRRTLHSTGWLAAARLAKLLEQLPKLRELIRTLGRLHVAEDPDAESVLHQVFEPVTRTTEELREVRSPLAPHEMQGIERSDSITRMLPSEAVLLGHPKLRMLWHARRAERALVTYRVEGTEFERVAVERVGKQAVDRPKPRPERGPLIVCVDTSGSMNGLPETVAKAVALEAARTAHREKRRCFLYAFGGPGDVVEHDLSFDAEGIARLLAFLSFSFGGGTDVSAPLVRAAAQLEREAWHRADLVLVTDGEFPVPSAAAAQLRVALEKRGARMHGILIGNARSSALDALCSPVHVFQSWDAMLGETV